MKPKLVMTDDGTPLPPDWRRHMQAISDLDEDPIHCPTCDALGYAATVDDRGTLVRHLGRAFLCRVAGQRLTTKATRAADADNGFEQVGD
jgi:hypothetical protein